MTRKLVYTPEALGDLDDIFDSIALDNPRRAMTYIEEIRQSCRNSCSMPHMGMSRNDLHPGLYILPLWRRIVIACELPSERVDIPRVFSGGQDYETVIGSD